LVDNARDGGAARLRKLFKRDTGIAWQRGFHDLARAAIDFERGSAGVGEAESGFVRLLTAFLRFKANIVVALLFLEVLKLALGL
jgi:hypothetical protein